MRIMSDEASFTHFKLFLNKIFFQIMKLGSLFSGGKDSTYAIYLAKQQGHEIACLLTITPKSDESHLLHYPKYDLDKTTI